MRPLILAVLLSSCAPVKVCEFPLWVRVTPNADEECRAAGAKWTDSGAAITDRTRLRGCAPQDQIITDGTYNNLAHEMEHQIERNCR